MTKDPAVIENWIEQCLDNVHKLTTWEMDFINSLSDQFSAKNWISDKQEEILERIYAEKT